MSHKPPVRPLEIYVHIPFCARKCLYCDFLSFPVGQPAEDFAEGCAEVTGAAPAESIESDMQSQCHAYMQALYQEIRYAAGLVDITQKKKTSLPKNSYSSQSPDEEAAYEVQSVYIGGGTPSLINEGYITKILCELRSFYTISSDAEITIEANPGTLTAVKLQAYRQAGINRLSMGLQSANDEELRRLGRIHTYEDFLESYRLAREAGFTNISVDLMTALPGQSMGELCRTLEQVTALQPEHISAYSLIIEPGTPYEKRYSQADLPPEEEDRAMYEMTRQCLEEAGYHRYEISNYARAGYESRHNMGYWKRTPYLGLGLGASSLLRECRWKNEADLTAYIRELSEGKLPCHYEEQSLTERMQMEEYLFLGLRMTAGIQAAEFERLFHRRLEDVYGTQINTLVQEQLLERFDDDGVNGIRLTLRGLDLSNYVFVQFL